MTTNGAEVDCIIDTGTELIPIEIKRSQSSRLFKLKGLTSFLNDYSQQVNMAYVVADIRLPEKNCGQDYRYSLELFVSSMGE